MNEIIKKGFEEIFQMPQDKIENMEVESNFAHLRKCFTFGVLWQRKKTDEFAIDFAEWIDSNNYVQNGHNGYWIKHTEFTKYSEDNDISTKQLLEIFKKEAGL